jgi:hypothetical protein
MTKGKVTKAASKGKKTSKFSKKQVQFVKNVLKIASEGRNFVDDIWIKNNKNPQFKQYCEEFRIMSRKFDDLVVDSLVFGEIDDCDGFGNVINEDGDIETEDEESESEKESESESESEKEE